MRIIIETGEAENMIKDLLTDYIQNTDMINDIAHDVVEGLKRIEDD